LEKLVVIMLIWVIDYLSKTNMSSANMVFGKDKLAKKKAISKLLTKVRSDEVKKPSIKRGGGGESSPMSIYTLKIILKFNRTNTNTS